MKINFMSTRKTINSNMKMIKTETKFDCLKYKEEVQAKLYAQIKDMTPEERVAFCHIPKEQSIFKHIRND